MTKFGPQLTEKLVKEDEKCWKRKPKYKETSNAKHITAPASVANLPYYYTTELCVYAIPFFLNASSHGVAYNKSIATDLRTPFEAEMYSYYWQKKPKNLL